MHKFAQVEDYDVYSLRHVWSRHLARLLSAFRDDNNLIKTYYVCDMTCYPVLNVYITFWAWGASIPSCSLTHK